MAASPPETPLRRQAMEGGYRELLRVALPLVLSMSATTLQHFVDRMFLAWWKGSPALAASLPAGLLNFAILSIFIGTASYVSTFVAQYHGAGRPERIGPAIWQGLWIALIGGVVLLALSPFSEELFRFMGHDRPDMETVFAYEVSYFRILALGAAPVILSTALSGFYSGLGRTWPVLAVSIAQTAVNLVLDSILIFGRFGLPEMGMEGAAIATVISQVFVCVVYVVLLARRANDGRYQTLRGLRFDGVLFRRLLRFGLPSGFHWLLDIAGFSLFILLVGRLGEIPLAATNLAFNVNLVAFMPMMGIGTAVSVLVGQYLGRDRPDVAVAATWRGFSLAFSYMGVIAAAYFLLPGLFIAPFTRGAEPGSLAETSALAVVLLRFVAVYSLFDAMNIIFAAAVKGAGDTKYVMAMSGVLSVGLLVVPTWVSLVHLGRGVGTAWVICTAYVSVLGICFLLRFLGGKWKSMRVIEAAGSVAP